MQNKNDYGTKMITSSKSMRLQKVLAQAGLGSRRKCEQLILDGDVRINGKIVTELGTKVNLEEDDVSYRGKKLPPPAKVPKIYILLYKPRGYITSLHDEQDRPTVMKLLPRMAHRVFPVGRLDYNTEGLLLLTNDGELSNALTHPKHQVPRGYLVKVRGVLKEEEVVHQLKKGIYHGRDRITADSVSLTKTTQRNSWLSVVVHEGKNREIRRMFEALGHPVLKLKRTRFAFLSLKGLQPGESRFLSLDEVERLEELSAG
ncbi:MAG: pseudouridine synthase [bacterium]